jgi:hypothetical protein
MAHDMNILLDVRVIFNYQMRGSAVTRANDFKPSTLSYGDPFSNTDEIRIQNEQRLSDARSTTELLENEAIKNNPFSLKVQGA